MTPWLLVYLHVGAIAITPMLPGQDCREWRDAMKPEQKAKCIRVVQTPAGPVVERKE